VAIIGSRDASEQDLDFATRLGGDVAKAGFSVISGGARGIDQAALAGALDHGGNGIAILGEGLLNAATSKKYRSALMANDLALVSMVAPEVRFHVGNAMGRNKFVYCLADVAVVVASDNGKGGTWSGAEENLRHAWTPLWVQPTSKKTSGNAALVQHGARWLPANLSWLESSPAMEQTMLRVGGNISEKMNDSDLYAPQTDERVHGAEDLTLYDLFVQRVRALTEREAVTAKELSAALGLTSAQFNLWIKRALADGHVHRAARPVRYSSKTSPSQQVGLFP
jgi:predicted Rossmann fold nucleotide-binding protein DprA/Smf involved in DNA uptake